MIAGSPRRQLLAWRHVLDPFDQENVKQRRTGRQRSPVRADNQRLEILQKGCAFGQGAGPIPPLMRKCAVSATCHWESWRAGMNARRNRTTQ